MLRKLQQLRKREQGFTIIEVLIVLAIAALILVIVLIAIPQLQRNQRNTARKNDIGRIGTAVNEFQSNNNGKLPATTPVTAGSDLDKIVTSIGDLAEYDFPVANYKSGALVVADEAKIAITKLTTGGSFEMLLGGAEVDKRLIASVQLLESAQCDTTQGKAIYNSNTRAIAIVYNVEGGGGKLSGVCQNIQ